MEEKKNNKGLIWVIIILVLSVLGLIGFIVYEKKFNKETEKVDKNTTTKTEEKTSIINGVLPSDLSKYYSIIWDYELLHNKYFTMKDSQENFLCYTDWCNLYNRFEESETSNKEFKPYNFVKIENNKLLWNISGEWINDRIITSDIKLLYIDSYYEQINSFVILTSDNILYRLEIGNEFIKDYEADSYILTNEIYNSYKYNEIKISGVVQDVKFVGYPIECDGQTIIYFEVENNIYALSGNVLIDVEEFVKTYYKNEQSNFINKLTNTCVPNNNIININYDGTLYQVKNSGSSIKVKYYFKVAENDNSNLSGNEFHLIIDDSDNLYVIDRKEIDSIKELEVFAKVKDLVIGENEYEETIIKKVVLENGEEIVLSK